MDENINDWISKKITSTDVVLFMKGTPDSPQCGFSSTVVGILEELEIDYQTFNVFSDPDIRSGMKDFSQWPTFPQMYIKQEFIGGCDIVKELFEKGDLKKLFEDKKII